MNKEPIAIVVDIIRTYLGLTNDQIWQYNQTKVIPNTPGLSIIVHYLGSKPFGVDSEFSVDIDDNYIETISTKTQDLFSIELISKDGSAKLRFPEVMAALKSFYSNNQQETYQFRIAEVPLSVKNISTQDGGSMLTRIIIDTYLLSWNEYSRVVADYNALQQPVIITAP